MSEHLHQAERPGSFASFPALLRLAPYAALAVAVFLAYGNIYRNGFLFDDDILIVRNQFLRDWHFLPQLLTTTITAGANFDGNYYRPLQELIYLALYQFAGAEPLPFHLANAALHAVAAMLVYRLGVRLAFHRAASFLAALIWAVHPLHTEAVTYMSATADSLHVVFVLLGIMALLPDFSARRWAMAAPLIALALVSKESAVAFPLLAASCLYFGGKGHCTLRTYLGVWPAALIVIAYSLLHFLLPLHGLPDPHDPVPQTANLSPFAALPLYARLLLWPTGLFMEHDMPVNSGLASIPVLAGLAMSVAAACQALQTQTQASLPFSWGILWFAGALLPTFYIDNIAYEHWLYLPSIGLLLGAAQSLSLTLRNRIGLRRAASGAAVAAAAILGMLTWNQNKVWRDPASFYSNVIAHNPASVKAHANLGGYDLEHGEFTKAKAESEFVINMSGDKVAEAQHNLGVTLLVMPDGAAHADEALAHLRRALEINPRYYPTLRFLADYYAAHGDLQQAESYKAKADALARAFKTMPANAP